MMKIVIMGVVAFLVSLGGTTGALVMQARKAHPAVAADSVAHHDSAAVTKDSADARVAAEPHDTAGAAPLGDPAQAASHHDSVDQGAEAAAPADSVKTATPTQSVLAAKPPAPSYKQLARIFANMKTTDAVKVLAYMSDEEVEGVLRQLGVRPAAGLLAALPKERAAVLSRRLLDNDGKGTK
jgi:flagellar motility protein MotE (MotC chaperone)